MMRRECISFDRHLNVHTTHLAGLYNQRYVRPRASSASCALTALSMEDLDTLEHDRDILVTLLTTLCDTSATPL